MADIRASALDNGGQGCSHTVMANQLHDRGEPPKLDNGSLPSPAPFGEPAISLSGSEPEFDSKDDNRTGTESWEQDELARLARREWLYCPTGAGEMRFHKERFEAMLEREGVIEGKPPTLPSWCEEPSEKHFNRLVERGIESWTYFARGLESGRIKIGKSKEPHRRVSQLAYCRFGEKAELVALRRGDLFERAYHNAFREWSEGHEWFAPHPDILAEIDRLNGRASA